MLLMFLAGEGGLMAVVHYFLAVFFTIFTVAICHDQLDTATSGVRGSDEEQFALRCVCLIAYLCSCSLK